MVSQHENLFTSLVMLNRICSALPQYIRWGGRLFPNSLNRANNDWEVIARLMEDGDLTELEYQGKKL